MPDKKVQPTKLLTEAEAWRYLAEKILTDGFIASGICLEIEDLGTTSEWTERGFREVAGIISEDMVLTMKVRVKDWQEPGVDTYDGGCDDQGEPHPRVCDPDFAFALPQGEYHEERAMACEWFALEAELEASTGS